LGLKLDILQIIHIDNAHQQSLLAEGNLIGYCAGILSVIWHNMNLTGFVSALLILITWFIYIYRIDIFHKESLRYALITLFLGMGFSLLTFLISDIVNLVYHITYTGNLFNDLFLYSFLGIGVIEEFVKLIPFLIILKFTMKSMSRMIIFYMLPYLL
jgi:RsiW-degrading membrane proteinase PrsW (M82 family)